jgi:pseudouridine-5'-phosphate glycosidase
LKAPLALAPEVAAAVADRRAVVALETTVVTHGLPHPDGLEVAAALETEVRAHGAVPATIGILGGAMRVGLSRDELEQLATRTAEKVGLGNLAACLAGGGAGSTTVAATLYAAARAGIRVFATGGIGGVHRGASETGDVSADLTALARFPVAVVCAGAKAVLDLGRTLEALETLGVPVYGVETDRFPAFYRRDSGLGLDRRFETTEALAAAVAAHFDLGIGSGVVVANPVPSADEMPRELYEEALAGALSDAVERSVRGRDVTPFLLERLRARTGGASVGTNRALLVNNARVAAMLAVELSRGHLPRS